MRRRVPACRRRDLQVVDAVLVQVVHRPAGQLLELADAADADRFAGLLVAPDGQRRAPVAVAADRPVARAFQPPAEAAVADVLRDPADAAVGGQHPFLEIALDPDEPGGDGAVDQRRVAAPAERVVVDDGALGEQGAGRAQGAGDRRVGVLDELAGVLGHLVGEAAVGVDRADHGNAGALAEQMVVLAETGGDVDDAGAVIGGHEVGGHHPERAFVAQLREVAEQRFVAHGQELRDRLLGDRGDLRLALAEHRVQAGAGQDQRFAVRGGDPHVVDVGAHGQRHVRRQRPRRGGPGQDGQAGCAAHPEADGDRRVLRVLVAQVDLEVGQRRRAARAVGQRLEALVDQALVPQRLEHPPDRLHEVGVHGPVLVVPVDPAAQALDQRLPLGGVAQHHLPAVLVERADAVLDDVGAGLQAELALRLVLYRQAVAVPAPAPLHAVAAHGPVARHHVLGDGGEQVPVVRQAGGERRPVVEAERPLGGPVVDRLPVQVALVPEGQDLLFHGREVDLAAHRREDGRRCGCGAHRFIGVSVPRAAILSKKPPTRCLRRAGPTPPGGRARREGRAGR